MEMIISLVLFCSWHVLVLGAGVWLGVNRPWQWKVIKPGRQPEQDKDGFQKTGQRVYE